MLIKKYNKIFAYLKKGAKIHYTFCPIKFFSSILLIKNNKVISRIREDEYDIIRRVLIFFKEISMDKRVYKLNPKYKNFDTFPYKEVNKKSNNINHNYYKLLKEICNYENKLIITNVKHNFLKGI